MRRLVAAVLAALALLVSASPAVAAEPQTSLADLEDEVMCTICGTTLQLANAPQAQQERDLINQLVAEGQSKDEIKAALVVEYGPEVLAVPSTEGFDLAAWIVPIAGLAIGLVAIVLAARRWRRDRDADDDDRAPAGPGASIDPAEEKRLRTDLGRYDL